MSRPRSFGSSVVLCFALPIGAAQVAEQPKTQPNLPTQYTASAISQGGSVAGKTIGLTIYIDAVSSDGKVAELAENPEGVDIE